MQQQNLYSVLGVKKTANFKEIKTAYRILAKQHHPDKNFGNAQAEERFKKIHLAYTILSDLTKRRDYDLKSEVPNKHRHSGYGTPSSSFQYANTSTRTSGNTTFSDVIKDGKQGLNLLPLLVSIIIALVFLCFIALYKV
jgi:DnaJ-class molecular chaperone